MGEKGKLGSWEDRGKSEDGEMGCWNVGEFSNGEDEAREEMQLT
jgi:hypothetical protein